MAARVLCTIVVALVAASCGVAPSVPTPPRDLAVSRDLGGGVRDLAPGDASATDDAGVTDDASAVGDAGMTDDAAVTDDAGLNADAATIDGV